MEEKPYNKKRLFALVVLILLLLLVIFLIWWWLRPPAVPRTSQTNTPPPSDTVVLPPQRQVLPPLATPRDTITAGEAEVMNLARNFTERYGSWSTDSRYQNLYDLFPSVTQRLRREFERTVASAAAQPSYRGVETKVVHISIQHLREGSADVVVTAQSTETGADLQKSVTYRQLALSMVKQGTYWYVDSAQWQ